jgi:hypothetical protein
LPSGYIASTIFGGNGCPAVSRTPLITILGNNFGTFLDYNAGSYPIQESGANVAPIISIASNASCTINNTGSGDYGTLPVVLGVSASFNWGVEKKQLMRVTRKGS